MGSSIGFRLRSVRILATNDKIWSAAESRQEDLQKFIEHESVIYPDDADSAGETLLDYAINRASGEALAFLVQFWGDELGKDSFNPRWFYKAHDELRNRPHNKPMEEAQALQKIISIGEEIVDAAETPLHEAVGLDGSDDEVRQRVREAAEQCAWAVDRWNNRGKAPLHVAAERGNLAAVKELVRLGCDFEQRDFEGFTALMRAAWLGRTPVARHLLDDGCSVDAADVVGFTALHCAANPWQEPADGPAEMLRILLSAGAAVDARDEQAETALHQLARSWATKDAIKARLRVLVEAGADINERNNVGDTALMMSVKQDRLPSLQAFIEADASTKHSNLFSQNLLHLGASFAGIHILEYVTTVDPLGVDHEHLDIDGDSPWDAFIETLHTPKWALGSFRKPDTGVQNAFVALYQCTRDRNLQFDIDALKRVRQCLDDKDGRGAAAALAPLIKRKQQWKRQDELRTYKVVALQVREGMWEGALEAINENVELLLVKMEESQWDQDSCWDWLEYEFATESSEEEEEDDCVTITDEESGSDGQGGPDEEDRGSHEDDDTL